MTLSKNVKKNVIKKTIVKKTFADGEVNFSQFGFLCSFGEDNITGSIIVFFIINKGIKLHHCSKKDVIS